MKTLKIKTNEQKFKELFKELDSLDVALLRERVLKIVDITNQSIEQEPEKWKNGFIHPDAYKRLNKKIIDILGFENEKTKS